MAEILRIITDKVIEGNIDEVAILTKQALGEKVDAQRKGFAAGELCNRHQHLEMIFLLPLVGKLPYPS